MGRLTIETIAQLKEFVCYHRTLCDDAICRKEEGCFVNWAIEGLQELQRYKDLEEQGRLIELPCAVGDTVYIVMKLHYRDGCFDASEYKGIEEVKVENITIGKPYWQFNFNEHEFLPKDFGVSIFLTKEEAEAKLKELEG